MRGKGKAFAVLQCTCRITPAYAGKSTCFLSSSATFQDHPRLCGEKSWTNSSSVLMLGSPPPMRGKVVPCAPRCRINRITPAYAGKRALSSFSTCLAWDHPRLCGEKVSMVEDVLGCVGSPPPMRGKVHARIN